MEGPSIQDFDPLHVINLQKHLNGHKWIQGKEIDAVAASKMTIFDDDRLPEVKVKKKEGADGKEPPVEASLPDAGAGPAAIAQHVYELVQ